MNAINELVTINNDTEKMLQANAIAKFKLYNKNYNTLKDASMNLISEGEVKDLKLEVAGNTIILMNNAMVEKNEVIEVKEREIDILNKQLKETTTKYNEESVYDNVQKEVEKMKIKSSQVSLKDYSDKHKRNLEQFIKGGISATFNSRNVDVEKLKSFTVTPQGDKVKIQYSYNK